MPKFDHITTDFTAGEISPDLLGRVGLEKYRSGVETLENYIVFPQGGVYRRPGTFVIDETKHSELRGNKKVRLIPWEFNETDAYMIEAGEQYFRFFKDGARVEIAGVPVEVVTPYLESELFELDFAQAADTLYITHRAHKTAKLVRTSSTSWTLSNIDFANGPFSRPLASSAESTITLTPSGATGSITLTASVAFFRANHVGIRFYLNGGFVTITSLVGAPLATVANATVNTTLTGTGASADWREDSFSDYRGYPRAVTFFEQRLILGGTDFEPNAVWASVTASFEDFEEGTADDDAKGYTIASGRINAVQWLSSLRSMLIGTRGDEFKLTSIVDPQLRSQSNHGSSLVRPVVAHSQLYFVQKGGKIMRALEYSQDTDTYLAPEATYLSNHILGSGVVQLAYQQDPHPILWAVREDGQLAALTLSPEFNVVAWSRHTTQGHFESAASIPTSDGTTDELWVCVRRVIEVDGLRSLYRFDETSGRTVADDIGGRDGRILTMGEDHTRSMWNNDGWVGGCLDFDGTGFVSLPVGAVPDAGDFSIAYWFKPGENLTSSTAGDRHLFHLGDDDSCNDIRINFLGLNTGPSIEEGSNGMEVGGPGGPGCMLFRVYPPSGATWRSIVSDATSWNKDVWYFVACTFSEASGMRMHIARCDTDPAPVQQADTEAGFLRRRTPKSTLCAMGAHTWASDWGRAGRYWKGSVDHLRIYDRALTAAEVAVLYNSHRRYIERMDATTLSDSSAVYTGFTTDTFSGLAHLAGLEVDVFADGGIRPRVEVSQAGVATIAQDARHVTIGLPYTSTLKTLRIDGYGPSGTAQGLQKSFGRVSVRVKDTVGGTINGQKLQFMAGGDPMDTAPVRFTGDKDILALGWDRDGRILVQQEDPMPSNILAILATLEIHSG
jgi:hypothetical protein